jgi:hypothetical protein
MQIGFADPKWSIGLDDRLGEKVTWSRTKFDCIPGVVRHCMSGLSFPAVDKAIWLLSGIGEFKSMPEKSSRLLFEQYFRS